MIKKYYLRDCDPNNEDIDFDLKDENMAQFLTESLRHCAMFSIDVHQRFSKESLRTLSEFEIVIDDQEIRTLDDDITMQLPVQDSFSRHYYQFCDQSIHLLLNLVPSLFNFSLYSKYNMPENLTLYRQDRTIFFMSETHEGDAYLSVKTTENIQRILSLGPWKDISSQKTVRG